LQQNIVFSKLADNSCNPADFQCACNQLVALGVTGKVSSACSATDTTEYVQFQRNICANVQPVVPVSTPSSTSSATSVIVTPTTTPASTDLPSFSLESVTPTPEVISSTTTEVPYINSTSTDTESSTTETAAIVTSDSVGTVGPVPTTSAPPPDFMGAAATVSSFKAAALAVLAGGALGLMGFVVAEL
jgi:hypothetical protein